MLEHGLNVAQILLAPDDTETRRKHLNARATLIKLLELGVIPVINENDTVSTEEIKFGDNDRLAARVAQCAAQTFLYYSQTSMAYILLILTKIKMLLLLKKLQKFQLK